MCDRCPQPAARSVAAEYLCARHAAAILDPISERVLQRLGIDGYGVPQAPRGDGWHDLACNTCGATWVGRSHDPCWWCEQHRQHLQEHQVELLSRPPDVDPDDKRYEQTMTAWGQRLARAAEAGLMTVDHANRLWQRATRRTPSDTAA